MTDTHSGYVMEKAEHRLIEKLECLNSMSMDELEHEEIAMYKNILKALYYMASIKASK